MNKNECKITLCQYVKLRDEAYKLAGEVGTLAELNNSHELNDAYNMMCYGLDSIDELGVKLGFISAENNDLIDEE